MTIATIMSVFQMILAFGNICIMLYAFKTFLSKPHDTLEQRVNILEDEVKNIHRTLNQNNSKFDNQGKALEVVIQSTLALIEFEMEYCLTEHKSLSEGLKDAKKNLQAYLSKGK